MKLPDAQGLVTALMGLGYDAWATQVAAGDWHVQTTAPALVDQPTVNGFAAAHTATVESYNVTTAVSFR